MRQLPSQCAVCHAWPARRICDVCVARFAAPHPRCPTCALRLPVDGFACENCGRSAQGLDGCLAAVSYEFPWSNIVQQYKFHGQSAWARTLAQLIRASHGVDAALQTADVVVPMPLSSRRLRERGFNQSALLADCLAPKATRNHILIRILDTPPQSSLSRESRIRNVRSAYAVEPGCEREVQGLRVVLVDDVMTSGASMEAAAQVLRKAGASHITGLVFARAEFEAA